jgi:hypothetical protein
LRRKREIASPGQHGPAGNVRITAREYAADAIQQCKVSEACGLILSGTGLHPSQPRYLANAANRAVTPISPAAQKFHLLILCSVLDSSATVAESSMPDLMLGKRHIADMNQNTAEPHAVAITAVSMNDLITAPESSGSTADHTVN